MGKFLDWIREKSKGFAKNMQRRKTEKSINLTKSKTEEKREGIFNIRMELEYDTAKREEVILKELKNKVYSQDKTELDRLINLFKNSEHSKINQRIISLRTKISGIRLNKNKKSKVKLLLNKINPLEKDFNALVKQRRVSIERIKASIKDNDFGFAEQLINQAIGFEEDLDKTGKIILKNISMINNLL